MIFLRQNYAEKRKFQSVMPNAFATAFLMNALMVMPALLAAIAALL